MFIVKIFLYGYGNNTIIMIDRVVLWNSFDIKIFTQMFITWKFLLNASHWQQQQHTHTYAYRWLHSPTHWNTHKHTEVITCHSLTPPSDGTLTFSPGANNSNIGLGSVATYSCNTGYVLVGPTSRICQRIQNGVTGAWSGHASLCRGESIGLT